MSLHKGPKISVTGKK